LEEVVAPEVALALRAFVRNRQGRGFDVAYRLRRRTFSAIIKAFGLLSLSVFFSLESQAASFASNVLCRPDIVSGRRNELANKLRTITGWHDLGFDENGALNLGKATPSGGSETARKLLAAAVSGEKLMVLEDASNRADVVFCSVVEGLWTKDEDDKPPVFVILIDFADFSRVTGDRAALAAFNVGWGVLHEIDHVVRDSVDPKRVGEAGECEDVINKMRRECGLAERADYHFSFIPGTNEGSLTMKLVRLAFEQQQPHTNKKKRYWLIWDANLVGGLKERILMAGFR